MVSSYNTIFSPSSRAISTAWAVVTVTFFSWSRLQVAPSMVQSDKSNPEISAPEKFSASALPFSRRDIDLSVTGGGRGDRGDQRHSPELREDGLTHVHVDLVQMGLGCENSWGALPLPQYRIPAEPRAFSFRLKPLL